MLVPLRGQKLAVHLGPAGTVLGGLVGLGTGLWLGDKLGDVIYAKPPENALDPNGPKAPGLPTEEDGYFPPKEVRIGFQTQIQAEAVQVTAGETRRGMFGPYWPKTKARSWRL